MHRTSSIDSDKHIYIVVTRSSKINWTIFYPHLQWQFSCKYSA